MPILDARGTFARRDADATRAAILDAAESTFVERGFAATSMSEVANAAGVTKSLIHHHFGSKEELWQEVRTRVLDSFFEALRAMLEAPPSADDAEAGIEQWFNAYFAFLREHPEYARLSGWMNLEDPRLAETPDPGLMAEGVEWIAKAQRMGMLRDDIEPFHVMFTYLALCTHWFVARNAYDRRSYTDDDEQKADADYLADVLKIFLRGVRP